MATYTKSNSNDELKKRQRTLANAGYTARVNEANAADAIKDGNGLRLNGTAGESEIVKPNGKSRDTSSPQVAGKSIGSVPAIKPQQNTATSPYSYDAVSDAAYQQALAALRQAQSNIPQYVGTYDQQLNDLYEQIVNRDKFSFDLNSDALYQQYADQYTLGGKLAAMDTMGQASALTGGYGNSYAQTVGQQTYQGYLQQLNDVVPELYRNALDQYNAEGEQLYNQYAMLGDLADTEYGRYQDALNQYWQNVSYLDSEADEAYERGYNEWYNSYKMGIDADDRAYARQQDSYDRLVSLITSTGYTPTAEELMAAGMSKEQAQAYANYYAQQNTPKSSGGSSGGTSNSSSGSGTEKKTAQKTKTPSIKAPAKVEEPYNIEVDLNRFISQGASKSEINTFLREALKSGVITTAQYNSLKKTYAPAGNTY